MSPEPNTGARTITCPGCGGTVAIRAEGYSVTLSCEYCGSLIDVTDPAARLIQRYTEVQAQLAIPLGTRGTLRDVEWEVIGWLSRTDSGTYWEEYLLFNPYHGYRWLVHSYDQWNFGTTLTRAPAYEATGGFNIDGTFYKRFFHGGRAKILQVAGEFYWRVKRDEVVRTSDYVRPGVMLSLEENDHETSWTLNELLSPQEIVAAFPIERPPRWMTGITPPPHQPSPFAHMLRHCRKIALGGFVMLLLMFVLLGHTSPAEVYALSAVPDGPAVSRSFGPITLTAPRQALTITTSTPNVEQGWVDIDIAFVDRRTQARFEAYSVNEHYYGHDNDGNWSEGSREQDIKVSSLPAGTYDLEVDATAHSWGGAIPTTGNIDSATGQYKIASLPPLDLSVAVARGARFWSNLWIALLLLLAPLLFILWRHCQFEEARLAQSDNEAPDFGDLLAGLRA